MELKLVQFESIDNVELNEVNGGELLAAAATVTAVGAALYVCYQGGEAIGKFIYNVTN